MRTSGKNTFRGTMLVLFGAVSVGIAKPTLAQPSPWTTGPIIAVFADPQDFVVQLDQAGSCGSKYFNVPRSNANFKEMVAIILTAFSTNKQLFFHVASCAGDRNIVSNGFVGK